MTVLLEKLKEARAIQAKGHIRYVMYHDNRRCVSGAAWLAVTGEDWDDKIGMSRVDRAQVQLHTEVLLALAAHLPARCFCRDATSVIHYNNEPGTTLEDVLRLFNLAIEAEEIKQLEAIPVEPEKVLAS